MASKQEAQQNGQYAEEVQDPNAGFKACDLHLLESGEHADVRLECGDSTFDCHRAILAARSGWFKDQMNELAKMPVTQDGSLPIMHIRDPGAEDIQAVLVFIYAGEVDPRATDQFGNPTESVIKANIRLFNLGHDFRVTGLAEFASDGIGKSLSLVLQMICDPRLTSQLHANGRTELQDRLRSTNFIPTFLEGLEAADLVRSLGNDEMERVRPWQMLIDFFIAGKEVLLREPELALFIEEDLVPNFAKSVLLTERRNGQCQSKWLRSLVAKPPAALPGKKGLCWGCGSGVKNIKENGGIALVNPRSREVTHSQVCCVRCVEKESNIGHDGLVKWEVFDAKKS